MHSGLTHNERERHERQRPASLSVQEAAIYAGVSVSYMNRLRTIGGGSAFRKIGRRVTYAIADLDDWLERCRRTSTAA
jgi:hypothetical protein